MRYFEESAPAGTFDSGKDVQLSAEMGRRDGGLRLDRFGRQFGFQFVAIFDALSEWRLV